MKIRSINEFEDFVAKEYAWRRKELTNLRNLTLSAKKSNQESMIRCTVAILYAHWEGFIKNSSMAKMAYISCRGLKYNQLKPSFSAYAAFYEFEGQIPVKSFEAITRIAGGGLDLTKSISMDVYKYIDTKSNLSSEVLKEIMLKISLDYKPFELKENLIDEKLKNIRNAIAHGNKIEISIQEFNDLYIEITELLETFKNMIVKSVVDQTFLKDAT